MPNATDKASSSSETIFPAFARAQRMLVYISVISAHTADLSEHVLCDDENAVDSFIRTLSHIQSAKRMLMNPDWHMYRIAFLWPQLC